MAVKEILLMMLSKIISSIIVIFSCGIACAIWGFECAKDIPDIMIRNIVTFAFFGIIIGMMLMFLWFCFCQILNRKLILKKDIEEKMNIPYIGDLTTCDSKYDMWLDKLNYGKSRAAKPNYHEIVDLLGQSCDKKNKIWILTTINEEDKSSLEELKALFNQEGYDCELIFDATKNVVRIEKKSNILFAERIHVSLYNDILTLYNSANKSNLIIRGYIIF